MSEWKGRIVTVLTAGFLAFVLFGVVYEIVARSRDRAWRTRFAEEQGLQSFTVRSANETLLWEYRPGTTYVTEGRDVYKISTNRHGFRDEERTLERPEGIYRVAFVGDSIVFGLAVERREGLVARYEEMANQLVPGRRVEALNFGIDGYNTPQIYELLKARVLAFSPDKVVYVFCLNDFDFEGSSGHRILYYAGPPTSFFFDKLWRGYRRLVVERRWFVQEGIPEWHIISYNRTRDLVFSKLVEMKRLADEHRISFEIAIVPVLHNDGSGWEGHRLRYIHDEISTFLQGHGIVHLDLLEAFEETDLPFNDLAKDLWHPTPKGHRLIAEALVALHYGDVGVGPEPRAE